MPLCQCDKREVNTESKHYIYEICKNCGKIIQRKPHICKYFEENSYCSLAEMRGYSFYCRIAGEYTKCKNGSN